MRLQDMQEQAVEGTPSSGYGVLKLSSEVPFDVISVNPLMSRLTQGSLRPGVSLLERIPASEVRATKDRLERTLVEDLPVRMENHFMCEDGTLLAMNGWCHNIVGNADPQELCYILIPEEGDEQQERTIVRDAYVEAYSMTYDNIYEVSNGHRLIRCLKASPTLPTSLSVGGMRISFPDVFERWLGSWVYEGDREEMRKFFLSSLSYLEIGRDADVMRKEFRLLPEHGDVIWCEGALVPISKDDFLFCCRDVSARKEFSSLEDERDTLQNESRSLRAVLAEGASVSLVFDVETGARIPTEDDIDRSGEEGIDDLDALVEIMRRRTREGGLPEQIENRSFISEHNSDDPSDRAFRLSWKMWDHDGAYHLFEVAFLNVETVGEGANRLFVVIKDLERAGTSALWESGLRGDDATVGVLTRKGFDQYCMRRREEGESDIGYLFAIEIDDFWNYGLDEQDEMLHVLAESLAGLAQGQGVRAARILRPLYVVCTHSVPDDLAAEAYAYTIKRRLDTALEQVGGLVVSVGFSRCDHDLKRGYRTAFECANRALRTAQKIGGSRVVAYRPEMADNNWLRDLGASQDESTKHSVTLRTFGFFDVFVDGRPVLFTREKAKELLALLTDRRGGFVSSRDAVTCLWEDEPVNKVTLARYRKVAMHLKDTLEEYGIADIVVNENGRRRLDASRVSCDLFEYLSGNKRYEHLFQGAYMLNYSWAEMTTGQLMFEREARRQREGA